MDYGFDSRRFYQKKLENLKGIDYPDLERAQNQHELNVRLYGANFNLISMVWSRR